MLSKKRVIAAAYMRLWWHKPEADFLAESERGSPADAASDEACGLL